MKWIMIVFFLVVPMLFSADSYSAESKPVSASESVSDKLSVEEMVNYISESIDTEEEILSIIPGIRLEADAAGGKRYTLNGKPLKDLEKSELKNLYTKVTQQKTRLNIERIQLQLETVQRAQKLNEVARQVTVPQPVPSAVSTPQVPQPPRAPQVPTTSAVQVPRVPSAPHTPSRR